LHALLSDPGGVPIACHIATRTAAFRYPHNVGFCPVSRTYPVTTMSTISEFSHTACSLATSGFGLPLPGLPADFATDLLARLWSGGTLAVCDHPLGNIIEFHGTNSIPNDLDFLGASGFRAYIESVEFFDFIMYLFKKHTISPPIFAHIRPVPIKNLDIQFS